MDFEAVADELFAGTREEFTALRDRRSREAKPDRELAKKIASLRKPTIAAWLINHLSRTDPDGIDRLARVGADLRQAHQDLAGAELRALSRQRHELVDMLGKRAQALARQAGYPFGDATARQVEDTLEAMVSDSRAADAVRGARLSAALAPGTSEEWLTAAAAPLAPPSEPVRRPSEPVKRPGKAGQARQPPSEPGETLHRPGEGGRKPGERARKPVRKPARKPSREADLERARREARQKARQETTAAMRERDRAQRALAKAEKEASQAAAAVAKLRDQLAEAIDIERGKRAAVTAAGKAAKAAERSARTAREAERRLDGKAR